MKLHILFVYRAEVSLFVVTPRMLVVHINYTYLESIVLSANKLIFQCVFE